MMRWIIILFSLCSSLILSACNGREAYHRGNVAFINGNYRTSLQAYFSSAKAGYAPAQYAVGYQYYYGLGVKQNDAIGILWFKRAAPRSPEAQYALESIQRNSPRIPWILGLHTKHTLCSIQCFLNGRVIMRK